MEPQEKLFDRFPETTKEQWIAQATKDLKGADFRATLIRETADGIPVAPFYTIEDQPDYAQGQPLFTHTDWEIQVAIDATSAAEANQKALFALNHGATALTFVINGQVDFVTLLQDIGVECIALHFQLLQASPSFLTDFDQYLSTRGIERNALNLVLDYDPIAGLVTNGEWEQDVAAARAAMTAIWQQSTGAFNVGVNGATYHNAGASPAYELACILAHTNEYLGWAAETAGAVKCAVTIATGPDYFTGIAKLRALRKVMALLLKQYGNDAPISIQAVSATRNLTIYDAYNNLLRTTTEALASAAGGCDSLTVLPFDAIYRTPEAFSERLARNIQLILKAESFMDKVSDVAAGSYFIEELTERLAAKAWAYFQEIEAAGGFVACLKAGAIQQKIEAFAAAEQASFDDGSKVLVGSNKYPLATELMRDQVTIPPTRPTAHDGTFIRPILASRLSAALESSRLANETKEQAS